MKALLSDEFTEEAFLRSDDPEALAQRLSAELVRLFMAGENETEIIDGLIALGHAFDFNDQWCGDDWTGQVFVSSHLSLEYRLDYDSARRRPPPVNVDLKLEFTK